MHDQPAQEASDFNGGIEGTLTYRMRKIHGEQFYTLVRMHLSFELDLNTEETDTPTGKAKLKKWGILPFSKKTKTAIQSQKGTEGSVLTEEGIEQVKQLVEYLSKEDSISQEGIFRRTGKLTRQQELKTALCQGHALSLYEGKFSVHDYASVLKGFLADLSEPLLTDQLYPAHCQIAELCSSTSNESKLLRSLQLLLLLLPVPNRIVLKYIINLLNKTAAHENSNKMNCDTLATLFTPHLLCPRKLSPEALHMNSQTLSGLVAFMIKKGNELFQIPPKLFMDIRAFWVEQEKKLLSPQTLDPNESTSDAQRTAQTVFTFVDRNLTAQANATEPTAAALAALYAHIQTLPESAQKRKLVKHFNKGNGQGTPMHIKLNANSQMGSRSLGDTIKKRIFQNKFLRKCSDVKDDSSFGRSCSEEHILSNTHESSNLLTKTISKSEDELSGPENYEANSEPNLLKIKHISNSTGSLNTPLLSKHKKKSKDVLKSFLNLSAHSSTSSLKESKNRNKTLPERYSRHQSEPPETYSLLPREGISQPQSNPESPTLSESSTEVIKQSPVAANVLQQSNNLHSPMVKSKLRFIHAAHTSTPSNLIRKNMTVNDYVLMPTTDDEKSMSPITQSTTKMTKAMQETMMTPRSRKPVFMVSASNLCGLGTLENGSMQYNSNGLKTPGLGIKNQKNCEVVVEESLEMYDFKADKTSPIENKENLSKIRTSLDVQKCHTSMEDPYGDDVISKIPTVSASNTCKEYYLSRSVLSASPVDLSFTSRTGDYEQSGSDLLVEEITNPGSDTSGIASGSTNSVNNSAEKIEETVSAARKRSTNLQRNDSKRSIKGEPYLEKSKAKTVTKQKHKNETRLDTVENKDALSETSF
ncbi:unnamed protein product [Trichogramma brassicae]|uniref:Rho-GAP domain-containing protein n=1 Tax=Trichogramma brassicae TaxID=86971 RepID=A0A6H5IW61_9HYME|nr:unnamed protein product [Trichogramma brassicae]